MNVVPVEGDSGFNDDDFEPWWATSPDQSLHRVAWIGQSATLTACGLDIADTRGWDDGDRYSLVCPRCFPTGPGAAPTPPDFGSVPGAYRPDFDAVVQTALAEGASIDEALTTLASRPLEVPPVGG